MSTAYEYVNEACISSELICSICQNPFIDPQQTSCEHTFCRPCITNWLRTGNTCPLCQQALSTSSMKPSGRMVRNMLDQLQVKCLACGQTSLERGNFNQHLNTCHNGTGRQQSDVNTTSNRRRTPSSNNHSSKNFVVFMASYIFVNIIFYSFRKDSSLSKIDKTDTKLDHDAVGMPISCPTIDQCPSRNISFEHSYLLNREHQTYLNYFYNGTSSRVAKWKLIYRGSIHGLNASAFHRHCDNQGETLIVMSTTNGYLFGGYVDANWTTPLNLVPTYSSSTNAFLFSLMDAAKTPAKKFSIDRRYRNYAIVNDVSSGPVFGGMNQPDIGTYEIKGELRCQIHFPSVYMGGISISSFPLSNECLINEMEVFTPIFGIPPTARFSIWKTILSLIATFGGWYGFVAMARNYNKNQQTEARVVCCLCLLLLWINYICGYLVLLEALLLVTLGTQWKQPKHRNLTAIRNEKRFAMVYIVAFLTYIIASY